MVRIDVALDLATEVEIADGADLLAHLAEVGLAHHIIDVGLEFRRHAPGLLDDVGDAADGDRHVLRPDQDQGDGGDKA